MGAASAKPIMDVRDGRVAAGMLPRSLSRVQWGEFTSPPPGINVYGTSAELLTIIRCARKHNRHEAASHPD